MNRLIILLFSLIFVGCFSFNNRNNNKKTSNNILFRLVKYCKDNNSELCCFLSTKLNKESISITKYNNYYAFKNNFTLHHNHCRTEYVSSSIFIDTRYKWLLKDYEKKSFLVIRKNLYTTNPLNVVLDGSIMIFIDSKTLKIIKSPHFKNVVCEKKGANLKEISLNKTDFDSLYFIVNKKGIKWAVKKYVSPTPLEIALLNSNVKFSEYLIQNGFPVSKKYLKLAIAAGLTRIVKNILKKIKGLTNSDIVEMIKLSDDYYFSEISSMLELYAKKQPNKEFWFKFFMAIRQNNFSTINNFIKKPKYGIEYKFKNYNNATPFKIAVNSFNFEVIKYLVEQGVKLPKKEEELFDLFSTLAVVNPSKTFEIVQLFEKRKILPKNSYLIEEFKERSIYNKKGERNKIFKN